MAPIAVAPSITTTASIALGSHVTTRSPACTPSARSAEAIAAASARSSSHDRATRCSGLVDGHERGGLGIDVGAHPQQVLGDRQLCVGEEAGVGETGAATDDGRARIADNSTVVPHERPEPLGLGNGPCVQGVVVGGPGPAAERRKSGGVGPLGRRSPEWLVVAHHREFRPPSSPER